jgi:hypothetical protein
MPPGILRWESLAGDGSRAPAPATGCGGGRSFQHNLGSALGWRWRLGFRFLAGERFLRRCLGLSSRSLFSGFEPDASLLVELFEQLERALEISRPEAHDRLKFFGHVFHGGLALVGLAQIEGAVFGLLVAGTAAGGLTAPASHFDEATVEEALGYGKQLMELAAQVALLGRKGSGVNWLTWHGRELTGIL